MRTHQRTLTWRALALAASAVAVVALVAQGPRPNVLVVIADDQGWGDLGFTGNPYVATPRLDALAREGAVFGRFFVQPVCAPTRAELLTGRYAPRGGVRGTSAGAERLDLGARTIAEVFKGAGYATGLFGKWHNGGQAPYHPSSRGFDEFYGYTQGHWPTYVDAELEHDGARVNSRGFLTDVLTSRAVGFVTARRRQPFFAILSLNTPHSPMQVPDAYWARYRERALDEAHRYRSEEDVPHTRAALAMVENIDDNVGRLLAALEQSGRARDTIVVYLSDNGPNGWRWNGDMKGRKGSVDEGGVRVPFVLRWPGRVAAGTRVGHIAGAIDLLPTLAELAGVDLPSGLALDGRSLAPLVLGTAREWPDRLLFAFGTDNRTVSVRSARHRLDPEGRLFDLEADPGQREDIAAREPALAVTLRAAAAQMVAGVLPREPDTRPYPVGGAPRTWLSAGEATPRGSVARSSRHPNSSFLTHWTADGDLVTWPVDVLTAGTYEVTAWHTAPASSVGTVVQVRFGTSSARATIREPHDPPLIGMVDDRVVRQESYTKAFGPLVLGVLPLSRGPGDLVLSVESLSGTVAWDVSGVTLRRTP